MVARALWGTIARSAALIPETAIMVAGTAPLAVLVAKLGVLVARRPAKERAMAADAATRLKTVIHTNRHAVGSRTRALPERRSSGLPPDCVTDRIAPDKHNANLRRGARGRS